MNQETPPGPYVVIDHSSAETLWGKLLQEPGVKFVAADKFDPYTETLDWKNSEGELPEQLPGILIHADLHVHESSTDSQGRPVLSGIEWALRLRQEPERFHCPIILLSFQRQEDVEAGDTKAASDGLLKGFLTAEWHARWVRLPQVWKKPKAESKPDDENSLRLTKPEDVEDSQVSEADQQSQHDLKTIIETAARAFATRMEADGQSELDRLAKAICKKLIERKHRTYRHGRGGFTTALWLLIGGVRAGSISLEQAQKAVQKIQNRHKRSDGFYDFELVHRYLRLIAGNRPTAATSPLGAKHTKRRNLGLIEDEYGWVEVLHSVLGDEWNVSRWPKPSEIPPDLSAYHLVLVDENLGDLSGLDVISDIRKSDPFVPLVLFTHNRDPIVTTEALERGASDVLLKQSSDSDDRDMSEYYKTFADLIQDYKDVDIDGATQLRRAWQIVTAMHINPPPTDKEEQARGKIAKAQRELHHAIFLIAIAAGAIGRDPNRGTTLRAAVVQLEEALRDAAEAQGATRSDQKTSKMLQQLLGEYWKDYRWIPGFLKDAKRSRHGVWFDFFDVHAIAQGRQRKKKQQTGRQMLDDPCKVAGYCVGTAKLMRGLWFDGPKPILCRSGVFEEPKQRQSRERTATTHEARSRLGAVRFLLGYHLVNGQLSQKDVTTIWMQALQKYADANAIFSGINGRLHIGDERSDERAMPTRTLFVVDDQAEADGWVAALTRALQPSGYGVEHFARSAEEAERKIKNSVAPYDPSSSVVLLDLRLPRREDGSPEESVGRALLHKFRTTWSEVPVIVFSATESAYWARRCLRHAEPTKRAQGYFPKSGAALATDPELETGEFFCRYYEALHDLLRLAGPLVARNSVIETCERLGQPKTYEYLRTVSDRKWCKNLKDGLKKSLRIEPNGKDLPQLVAEYVAFELGMVRNLAWAAEDPYHLLLAQRLFPTNREPWDPAWGSLALVPMGVIEGLAKIVICAAWGYWPTEIHHWDAARRYFENNRDYFTLVNSDAFKSAVRQVNDWRRQVRYEGASRPNIILAPYCQAVKLLCEELEAVVDKVNAGNKLTSATKPQQILQLPNLENDPQVGDHVDGIVTNIKDYGAFVNLGGNIDGLLHITEISWGRVESISDVLSEGQKVQVKVISIEDQDGKKRISLSMKQLEPDPWDGVETNYAIGGKRQGRISNIVDYGAFVELNPGVVGLLPVAQISSQWVRHPCDVLSVDEEVEVRVIAIDQKQRRITLSMKQVTADSEGQRPGIGLARHNGPRNRRPKGFTRRVRRTRGGT